MSWCSAKSTDEISKKICLSVLGIPWNVLLEILRLSDVFVVGWQALYRCARRYHTGTHGLRENGAISRHMICDTFMAFTSLLFSRTSYDLMFYASVDRASSTFDCSRE